MDIFGATVTAIHELWTISIFIKGVVDDVRSYGEDKKEICDRVLHEFQFIEGFKRLFIDADARGLPFYSSQSEGFLQDCKNIIDRLNDTLSAYEVQARKHELIPKDGVDKIPDPEKWMKAKLQHMVQRAADLKKKAYDWSIFDKPKLFRTLDKYREWTGRLRENSSMIIASMTVEGCGLQDEQSQLVIRKMELQKAFERQAKAVTCELPANLAPMDGCVNAEKVLDPVKCQVGMAKLAASKDEWDDAEDVVAELRYFEPDLPEYSHDLQRGLVRKLAWLLMSSSFTATLPGINNQGSGVTLLSLNFKGYINLENQKGVTFVYELPRIAPQPSIPTITTLYDLINRSSAPGGSKPSLANRFLIAHTLANTIQNIHCSLWVHKNIWSKGVIVTDSPNTKRPSREAYTVPYLAGWGVARPSEANTNKVANHDVFANLYRHPKRQGQPDTSFRSEHDLYALGVVLIEIGCWQTVDQIFEAVITKGHMPKTKVETWWRKEGRTLLNVEVGEGFSEAVDWCLGAGTKIAVATQQKVPVAGWLAFRESVVDVLARGLDL